MPGRAVVVLVLAALSGCGDAEPGAPPVGPFAREGWPPSLPTAEALNPVEAAGLALDDLAGRQHEDGGWSEPTTAGAPAAEADVALTGVVLSAFLGYGHTHRGPHPHARRVARGLRRIKTHLLEAQEVVPPAAFAMIEAFGATESAVLAEPAKRGLDGLATRALAGTLRTPEDVGWTLLALASARLVNLDARTRDKPEPFDVRDDDFRALASWAELSDAPTLRRVAVATLARLLFDPDEGLDARLAELAPLLTAYPTAWTEDPGAADPTAAFFGAMAVYYLGHPAVSAWKDNAAALGRLARDGGWRAAGSPDGGVGPIAATALWASVIRRTWLPYDLPQPADLRAPGGPALSARR